MAAAGVGAAAMGLGGTVRADHAPSDFIDPEYVAGGGNNYNVWPSDNPNPELKIQADIQNVQWAIDNVRDGGVVKLKAKDKFFNQFKAFNFGQYFYEPWISPDVHNGVNIWGKNITIQGETLPDGMTTILGGTAAFFIFGLWELGEGEAIPSIRISNLKIVESWNFAIISWDYANLEVTNCILQDVRAPSGDVAMAILSHSVGKMTVKGCQISISEDSDTRKAVAAQGIIYYGYGGEADVDFQNNIITVPYSQYEGFYPDIYVPFPAFTGIVAVDPFEDVGNKAIISNNTITGESGVLCCGMNEGSQITDNIINEAKYIGIGVGWNLGLPLYNAIVTGNEIRMTGNLFDTVYGLESYGILVLGDDNVLNDNVISIVPVAHNYEVFTLDMNAWSACHGTCGFVYIYAHNQGGWHCNIPPEYYDCINQGGTWFWNWETGWCDCEYP